MTDLTESAELLPGSGVVQQIHGHDEVDRSRWLDRRDVLMQIRAAQGMPQFFLFRQPNHLRRDIDARDVGCSSLFEQARVEPVPAGHVQHLLAANVSQHLEQCVPLNVFPKREPLGVPVRVGDGVVFFHVIHQHIYGFGLFVRIPAHPEH